ncbi:2058_t:CDS:2 [Acaulospora colombiana]|uniref:2058_t:CDS:1 n=1 Tax=Acaulospora colombiana TaxID=27376 RepID=A0ACA9LQT6_9GLOM|nr:2058_t:CDS:2 [Acaulospora colombiana]
MSFYPFGSGGSQQTVNQHNVALAEQELEMVTDTFYRIVSSCYQKCIPPKYIDSELNKGESVCIDRCVSKFFEVNQRIGESLQKKGQQAAGATGFQQSQ